MRSSNRHRRCRLAAAQNISSLSALLLLNYCHEEDENSRNQKEARMRSVQPIAVEFSQVRHIVHACIRLHNFCIDERLAADPSYSVDDEVDNFVASSNVANDDFYYCETVDGDVLPKSIRASVGEMSRSILVDKIANLNLKRPARSAPRTYARRDKDIRRTTGAI